MKKKLLLIVIIVLVAIIVATTLIVLSIKNKNNKDNKIIDDDNKNYEIVEIIYSYGGGFGTMADTADRTITFTPNGKVKLSNSFNSYTETLNIDKSKYAELKDFITKYISLFDEEPEENTGVLDGGHSSIKLKLENGQSKEIGGYMITNKNYDKIKDKIYEIVGTEKIRQYDSNIKMDE